MTDTLPQRIEAAERKPVIENGGFMNVTVTLGSLCYIEQGEALIVMEPEAALAMADKIAAHYAAALRAKDHANG